MKCKFFEYPDNLTERDCYIYPKVFHHMCSNEYLILFDFEVESHVSFCSKECASLYLENTVQQNSISSGENTLKNDALNSDCISNDYNTKRRKHTEYDFETKWNVLKTVEESNDSISFVAKQFNIPRKTLSTWNLNKQKMFSYKENKKIKNFRNEKEFFNPF